MKYRQASLWIVAAIAALVATQIATPSSGQETPSRDVGRAVGTTVLTVGCPRVTLPGTVGHWKPDGYDVDGQPVGASLQAIQQLVAGNADFAEVTGSAIIQTNTKNNLRVRVVM